MGFPIHLNELEFFVIFSGFGVVNGVFHVVIYIGLLLGLRQPEQIEIQHILNNGTRKLTTWKEKPMLRRQDCLLLINSFLTSYVASKWANKEVRYVC